MMRHKLSVCSIKTGRIALSLLERNRFQNDAGHKLARNRKEAD